MADFPTWLNDRLRVKGWKPADLAKKGNIDTGFLSRILNGERLPGYRTCQAIARALDLPEEEVLRAAGKRSSDPGKPPGFEEWVYLYMTASETERQEMLDYARFKKQRRPATG